MSDGGGQLKLLAQDEEDLQVLSAALQDAVARIGDIRWEAKARRLTVEFNRFLWESPDDKPQRARAGLDPVTTPRDVLVLTRAEWDRDCRVPVSLANTVLHEGKILYER